VQSCQFGIFETKFGNSGFFDTRKSPKVAGHQSVKVVVRHILIAMEGDSPLCPPSVVTGCDILFQHTVSCPYSTATRYELVA